jgi:methylmalonyl-CoA/ethylmalonyl-CoA epimerase
VKLDRIDHIGVAVEDLDAAMALYGGPFGLPDVHHETVPEQGVEAVLLDVGEGHVELLAPLDPDTPVGRFLDRRGPGLHHVACGCPKSIRGAASAARGSRSCIPRARAAC